MVQVLPDGTYLTVLIDPQVRGKRRRAAILAAAMTGEDLTDAPAHLVRVIEYDVPDREGNGTGELIVVLTTITEPAAAHPDELAAAYHQRWEEQTGNDQLKTHLRGPGRVLRSRLPELVHQEIWAWLLVHHAISVLISQAAEAADLDPDRVSFTRVLRLVRRTATGTAAFPPEAWDRALPFVLAEVTRKVNPQRRHRSYPRAIKRARHNSYRVKKPGETGTRHPGPPTINIHTSTPELLDQLRLSGIGLQPGYTAPSSRSTAASSSAVPCTFGPVNQRRADSNHHPPANPSTTSTASGV